MSDERWLAERVPTPEGYAEMMAYIGARAVGKEPEVAEKATKSFIADAHETWTGLFPTRSELFATIERTILDELP